MFDTTAKIIRDRLGGGGTVDCTSPPVVGILASTGAILYASLIFGTIRAGCTVFPLSTRSSDIAIAHLITESGVKYLLVSQDAHMQEIARKANTILHSKNVHINIVPIPTYEEISTDEHSDLDALPPVQTIGDERVIIIAHFITAYSGMTISLFPPSTNAVIATPERLLASALATKSTTIVCPPMFLEHWVKDPSSIEKLRTFSRVSFGGGPLAQPVGYSRRKWCIINDGIWNVRTILHLKSASSKYSVPFSARSTEAGALSQYAPETPHTDGWQYFQFLASTDAVLVPIDGDHSGLLFQLIVKQCATNCLALSSMEMDGVPAFDTKDIVQRHPTNPKLYRVYGRVDDQIMHSNGEKTNPGPIEQILVRDPLIKAAIMFGRERPHAGVIITPSEDVYRQQANNFAPSHSRIFKDMIVLAKPSRPFQVTAKGTPRRQAILDDYTQDIDAAYTAFDNGAIGSSPSARRNFHERRAGDPSLTKITYSMRADSLLAARIRRDIMQALSGRVPDTIVQAVPNDIVFTSPTVAQLASFVYGILICAAAVPQTGDTPYKNVPLSILDNKDSTIVRLRESAAGEPPLILAATVLYLFIYMQKNFRTGLWAIQVTNETPRTSFVAQTDFYYRKIKEAQPTGPYRVGGYSAGGFMACRIAKLLEAHGDEVIQLAVIDSSPFLSIAPRADSAPTPETDFADPETLHAHHERAVRGLCSVMRGYKNPWWPKFSECAWNGYVPAFEFVLSLAGERKGHADVASRGVIMGVAPEARKEWWALGLDWCCEDLRVVEVEVDHLDTLLRDDLVEDLQKVVT
ncbi:hypothetical protein DFH09DRAFT_1379760 [Mycena vulgaris]|nr:hypothetical protein DFH09DRAFT_1379760 [Mycena vulgaris]